MQTETRLRHIVEAQQFTREWLEQEFFPEVATMREIFRNGGGDILRGKRMISFFYEPSTRTRASFEMAMDYLGGRVVFSTENARQFSSAAKGETLADTIRVLNRYRPDVIVLRSDEEDGAKIAADVSQTPIINAGDCTGQHPTQALLDVFTIFSRLWSIAGISIAMVGDLAKGRTVRSLSYLLAKFSGVRIYFVSPENMRMRDDIKDYLQRHEVIFTEHTDLREVASFVNVIYQTRTQKERGSVGGEGFYKINKEVLDLMGHHAIVMHPLPRVDEIDCEVDSDPRAVYLTDQIDSGLFCRMALLKMILGKS